LSIYRENQVICGENELQHVIDRFTFVPEVIDKLWSITTDKSARTEVSEMCGLHTDIIYGSARSVWLSSFVWILRRV